MNSKQRTQRDVAVDAYITVKEVHQDTFLAAEIDSISKNCNSVR